MRGFRIILLVLMLAMVAGPGAGAWLITIQPQPRVAEHGLWDPLCRRREVNSRRQSAMLDLAQHHRAPIASDCSCWGGYLDSSILNHEWKSSIPYSIPGQWDRSYPLRAIISRWRGLVTTSMSAAART
jgi:hypothetical protein